MQYNVLGYILTIFFMTDSYANILLEKPQSLCKKEIEQREQTWQTQFTWSWKNITSCTFIFEHNQAGFAFKIGHLPIYTYQYRLLPTFDEIKGNFNQPDYYFEKPLQVNDSYPKNISTKELIDFINSKKCIFYTGAGLSAASNIQTMATLQQSLEINKGMKQFLTIAFFNPRKVTQSFEQFCKSAIYSEPTRAHQALKNITSKTSTAIITENVDLLQQRTGIDPIFAYSKNLYSVSKEEWREVDGIICLGLSHDDRGLLAKYKKNNPNGIIISIDLKLPKYLSKGDFFHSGDLQEILPLIDQQIKTENMERQEAAAEKLICAWQQFIQNNNWQDLIKECNPLSTGCGIVYELPNFLNRADEDFAIVDMRNISCAEPHYHPTGSTEVYFVLQGSALVVVGCKERLVHAGDVIVIPENTGHYTIPDNEYVIAVVNTPPYKPENYLVLTESNSVVAFDYEQFKQHTGGLLSLKT